MSVPAGYYLELSECTCVKLVKLSLTTEFVWDDTEDFERFSARGKHLHVCDC